MNERMRCFMLDVRDALSDLQDGIEAVDAIHTAMISGANYNSMIASLDYIVKALRSDVGDIQLAIKEEMEKALV